MTEIETGFGNSVIVFGTGSLCEKLLDMVTLDIKYFIDNSPSKEIFRGLNVYRPEILKKENEKNLTIIIASSYFDEISEQLVKMECNSKLKVVNGTALLREIELIDQKENLKLLVKETRPLKIVIGSSGIYEQGWIPTEEDFLNLLNESDWQEYFTETSIDCILAEHVWEHLTIEEGIIAAEICYKYLAKGGYLRVAVPDGFHPNKEYIDWIKPYGDGPGADDHKILYDYKSLSRIFKNVGFSVNLLEYFNEEKQFVYNEWDPLDGKIHRSARYDERNSDDFRNYTSIILDAVK